jgi:hypothetical protein
MSKFRSYRERVLDDLQAGALVGQRRWLESRERSCGRGWPIRVKFVQMGLVDSCQAQTASKTRAKFAQIRLKHSSGSKNHARACHFEKTAPERGSTPSI